MTPPPTSIASLRKHLAVLDQAGLGGGAAHVEGDQPRFVQAPRQRRAADHAGRRAAFDDVRRCRGGERDRGQAAVGLHQLQRRVDAQRPQARIQRGDVGAHHRLDIGIDHGGAGARVFLDLRQDLMADRDRQVRQRGAHALGDLTLVRRVGVAVQQADRHAFHSFRTQHGDRGIDAGGVKRDRNRLPSGRSFSVTSSRSRRSTSARGLVQRDVVQHRHAQVANFQDVAEAACGDQRGAGAGALQHGVGADGRAVQHLGDLGAVGQQCLQAGDDALAIVVRGGGDLAGRDAPRRRRWRQGR